MKHLVLIRHGESLWNKENRFTGWYDVGLSELGRAEARQAGTALRNENLDFDIVYTSVLKRAIQTLNSALEEMDRDWLPVIKDWRLNERHYGDLTGLNKSETAEKFGEEQVRIWRRSYDTPPPLLKYDDPRHPRFDLRYKGIDPKILPAGESLKDNVARFLPLWQDQISSQLRDNKKVLIVAHGNSLRSLIMQLEKMTPEQIMEVNVPTGIPLLYKLETAGQDFKVVEKRYLGEAATVQAALDKVANQGKKK